MSDKRYPTRMHEVLGVATEERFMYSDYGDREFWLSESGLLYGAYDDGKVMSAVTQGTLVRFINNPERITRRPRLTEEQVDELKAAVKLGLFWLAKDENGTVSYYRDEPYRKSGGYQWFFGSSIQSLRPPQCSDVASLVSWSDPAPLDIVQTLRDAGVEIEEDK